MTPESRFVTTRHGRVAVTETPGDGPPVLFVHGNSSSSRAFRHQFDGDLGRAYRCIAFDLPGHGASDDSASPAADYNQPAYAETALDVLDALDAPQAVVAGWSLGGHVGIEMLAAGAPMPGLCIFGTPPCGPGEASVMRAFRPLPELAFAARETFSPAEAATFADYILGVDTPPPDLVESVARTDGRARLAMWTHWAVRNEGCDQVATVGNADVPIAVLHGANDPFVDGAYFDSVQFSTLWRDEVQVFEDTGHAPFLQRPQQFDALLGDFVATVTQ